MGCSASVEVADVSPARSDSAFTTGETETPAPISAQHSHTVHIRTTTEVRNVLAPTINLVADDFPTRRESSDSSDHTSPRTRRVHGSSFSSTVSTLQVAIFEPRPDHPPSSQGPEASEGSELLSLELSTGPSPRPKAVSGGSLVKFLPNALVLVDGTDGSATSGATGVELSHGSIPSLLSDQQSAVAAASKRTSMMSFVNVPQTSLEASGDGQSPSLEASTSIVPICPLEIPHAQQLARHRKRSSQSSPRTRIIESSNVS